MTRGCIGDCAVCGKCRSNRFPILDRFAESQTAFTPEEGYGIAVDLGTTTVVMVLLSLSRGTAAARHSFINPQRPFGADVVTRIGAAGQGKGEALRNAIVSALSDGAEALLRMGQIAPEEVRRVTVAGNTTMIYLLLGLPCQSLGAHPFRPEYTLRDVYGAGEIFASVHCPMVIAPWFGAFVGGDVTAGLLHMLSLAERRFMLMDLGTNGEMVLYDEGKLWVTATAAGPAFEGGLRGGASTVLDALACLVREGTVDETGLLLQESVFSQKQVRDLQLAKGAARAGLEILLKEGGVSAGDLGALYLAGGIGDAINIDSAVCVGLIPEELRHQARPAGNASLGGAAELTLAPGKIAGARSLSAGAKEINLGGHPAFYDMFMEHMGF